jgi:hypothetical protein
LAAHAAGLAPWPPKEDGTKAPEVDDIPSWCEHADCIEARQAGKLEGWTHRKHARLTETDIRQHWGEFAGMGVVCGAVSGNLEMFELEGRAVDEGVFDEFLREADECGLGELIDRIRCGYEELSPSGGYHWLYHCEQISGNLKLAQRPATEEELAENPKGRVKSLIETRGEGGYVITAPTPGEVHESGKPWVQRRGGFATIVTITAEERDDLHALARQFNTLPVKGAEPNQARTKAGNGRSQRAKAAPPEAEGAPAAARPGDDFNQRATWKDVLEPHDWKHLYDQGGRGGYDKIDEGGEGYWRIPGKKADRHGATTNYLGSDYLYVFSTSTDFEIERGYNKFAVYTLLNHDGDFTAAAAELADQGYGSGGEDEEDDWIEGGWAETGWAGRARMKQEYQRRRREERERVKAEPTERFRFWTMGELLDQVGKFQWLVKGLIADPTFGQVAGEMKTLKTYLSQLIMIAKAAGVPALGQFEVGDVCPVVAFVGEGGRDPWARRIERIAEAMDVNLRDIPLFPVFDAAPIRSEVFEKALNYALEEFAPGLVWMDPYYAYHGFKTEATNLYQEGALLTELSSRCADAGATFFVNNHFNQTGSGFNLKRITMAGGGEWADSWMLLKHREIADVENGVFRLCMEVGSRQWGGSRFDLDFNIGPFNHDLGTHDGEISWDVQPASPVTKTKDDEYRDDIRAVIEENPFELTMREVHKKVSGSWDHLKATLTAMRSEGEIEPRTVDRKEGKAMKKREVWGPVLDEEEV